MSPQHDIRPIGRILGALSVLLLTVLGPISPAAAHDAVTGTIPADGQNLDSVPDAIEISFTDTPLSLGSEILVKDAQGTDWSTGEVDIAGNNATQSISPDAPAGEYAVTWRVVSSDSHPIEGMFGFTVGETAAGASPSGTPSSGPSQVETATPEPSQSAATDAQPPTADETGQGFPAGFVVALGAVLVLTLVIVVMALARRRSSEVAGSE